MNEKRTNYNIMVCPLNHDFQQFQTQRILDRHECGICGLFKFRN